MLQVDKGIEVPTSGHGRRAVYPFATMAVGDSFFVPCDAGADARLTARRLVSAFYGFCQRHGDMTFTTRQVDGGVRCWRIS